MPDETLASPITILKNVGTKRAALYEKLGFQQVGRRKNYYAEVHEDAILMTLYFKPQGREDKR